MTFNLCYFSLKGMHLHAQFCVMRGIEPGLCARISKRSTNKAASPVQGNLRFQIGNEDGTITQLKQLFTMHEASGSIPSMHKINRKNLSYTDGKMEAPRIKESLQGTPGRHQTPECVALGSSPPLLSSHWASAISAQPSALVEKVNRFT